MKVFNKILSFKTRGELDIIDLTSKIEDIVRESGIKNGIVNVFSVGSTCAISIMEYEPGLMKDLNNILDRIAPKDIEYEHHKRWGDYNGHSHIRATLLKSSLTLPVINGELIHGTWQQIIFVELDIRPRDRRVVVSIIGE